MSPLGWLEVGMAASGIVLGVIGQRLELPGLWAFGIGLLGVGFFIGGVETIITREISFSRGFNWVERYRGAPAVCWGIIFLIGSSFLIGFGTVYLLGIEQAIARFVLDRPGVVLLVLGLATLCMVGRRRLYFVFFLA